MSETPPPKVGYLFFRCDDDDCDVTVRVPIPQGRWEPGERLIERVGWQSIPVPGGWLHYCPKCRAAS